MMSIKHEKALLANDWKVKNYVVTWWLSRETLLGTCQKLAGGRGGGILELRAENIVPLP